MATVQTNCLTSYCEMSCLAPLPSLLHQSGSPINSCVYVGKMGNKRIVVNVKILCIFLVYYFFLSSLLFLLPIQIAFLQFFFVFALCSKCTRWWFFFLCMVNIYQFPSECNFEISEWASEQEGGHARVCAYLIFNYKLTLLSSSSVLICKDIWFMPINRSKTDEGKKIFSVTHSSNEGGTERFHALNTFLD